ncbi:MAG: hypothetical protein SZ59_C0001G0160 [candidate division TM6 bacterium GW2011_GWF2_28_16]|nr:MAG: hypothetical protein SZ59_C0001G0160 [candidate division TM6 bacterium GW2011_GWF2_28_16]
MNIKFNILKKLLFVSLLFITPSNATTKNIYLAKSQPRLMTNLGDAMLFTIITQVINEYLVNNPEKLSLWSSAKIGVASWLTGELLETIYKTIYKKYSNQNLRDLLGNSKFLGLTIDHQRLLRRAISTIIAYIVVKNLDNKYLKKAFVA